MINGQPNDETLSKYPANNGAMAAAKVRGTAVTLAAAARSGGVTIAIAHHIGTTGTVLAASESASKERRKRMELDIAFLLK